MVKFVKVNKPALRFVNKFYDFCVRGKKSLTRYAYAITLKAKNKEDEYDFHDFLRQLVDQYNLGLFHIHYTYELDSDKMTHLHGLLITKTPLTKKSHEDFMATKDFFNFHFDLSKVKSPAWIKYMLKDQSSVSDMSFLRWHELEDIALTTDPIMLGVRSAPDILRYMRSSSIEDAEVYLKQYSYEEYESDEDDENNW